MLKVFADSGIKNNCFGSLNKEQEERKVITMGVKISDNRRGLLFKNGSYVRMLGAGEHSFWFESDVSVKQLDINEQFYVPDYELEYFLQKDEKLAECLDVVDVADNQLVLRFVDGKYKQLLSTPQKYGFWNLIKKNTFDYIDVSTPRIDESLDRNYLNRVPLNHYVQTFEVAPYMKGLLFFDNEFQEILEPGRYSFWKCATKVEVMSVDMRQKDIEIGGQEIMTEDKVPIRINFVCQYAVKDVKKAALEMKDFEKQIYVLLQMLLREYIGTFKLDDLLKTKQEIAEYILRAVQEKATDYGVEFFYAGLKDIILPGEIRDILNTVLIAEKRAMANVITRREETASTRSLLNTAKLMDENQTLYRLKELEYIEKICDRIDTISLSGRDGLLDSLNQFLATKN